MDIWSTFPVLKPGNEVHLQPGGGTLFADSSPHELSLEQAEFLAQCDGIHRVSDLIPSKWSETHGDLKFLLLVTRLIEADRLLLRDDPAPHQVCVTGSRSAYIPPHMSIELTAGCNLRCRHCYRDSDITKNSYMDTQVLLDILGRLNDAGLRSVELTGGEPLLHRDFRKILDFCSDRFALIGVLTNGTILTKKILKRFVGLNERLLLSISLDGSTAEAHDLRRGVPGSFVRTTRNIERLSQSGVKVRISMSVDEDSFFDIEDTLLLARRLGAVAFSYTPVLPLGRGENWAGPGWRLDGKQVLQAEQSLATRYEGFLSVLTQEQQGELEGGKSCGAGYRTYTMDPQGNVRPCAMFGLEDIVIGDLKNQGVEEVFANPATAALAKFPLPNRETCAGCKLEMFCSHCGLRGIQGSRLEPDCRWLRQPAVQDVLAHWSTASN